MRRCLAIVTQSVSAANQYNLYPQLRFQHRLTTPTSDTQHDTNMVVTTTNQNHNQTGNETQAKHQTQPQKQAELLQTAGKSQPHKEKHKTNPSPNSHFNRTLLSTHNTYEHLPFNSSNRNCGEPVTTMKHKQTIMANEQEFTINLTLHDYPASLLTEFIENIVEPYYNGNLNAAIQDLMHKTIAEQEFIHSHITMIRNKASR
jgi:hypothetical protein